MIRKTKKGPRRLREIPVYKLAVFVSTNLTEAPGITPGKHYKVVRGGFGSGWIALDTGRDGFIMFKGCAFLDLGNWDVEMRKEYR